MVDLKRTYLNCGGKSKTPDVLDAVCGRCNNQISTSVAECCFWCNGWLCVPCWDEWGHCGHKQAADMLRRAREMDKHGLLSIDTW